MFGNSWKDKNPNNMRIYYQNANSLQPHNMDKWKDSILEMKTMSVDVMGMCETCVNWHNISLREKFVKTLQKQNRSNKMVTSTISTTVKNAYIPGGTVTILFSKWIGRYISNINDPYNMGR
jgi:hypothetical protein